MLPLPWAAETISVTCAPNHAAWEGKSSFSPHTVLTAWLCLAMFAVSAAAQSTKLWMPTMLIAQQKDTMPVELGAGAPPARYHFADGPNAVSFLNLVHAPLMLPKPNYSVILVLAQGYLVQLVGIILCAYVSTWVTRKQMVQWSLLGAAFFTLVVLGISEGGVLLLCGPLIGVQLAAQTTGLNFLQVFTSEHFPTSMRAKTCAAVNFAAQLGSFVIPVIGGFIVQWGSASIALVFFSALYLLGWAITHRLPLPTAKERPLHDIDELASRPEKSATQRKGEWPNYQAI